MLLRREELEAEDVIAAGDNEAWTKFTADRFGWIMMNPEKCDEVWRAIWRHVPPKYEEAAPDPPDNVVDLLLERHMRRR